MDITEENKLFDVESCFEESFCENVTFSTSRREVCNFSDTLTFVKGFSASWNEVSKLVTTQCDKSINNSVHNVTNRLKCTQEFYKNDTSLLTKNELKHWGIPPRIVQKYNERGIVKMFPWQVECLSSSDILLNHRNLIYSAPTSAGKTLVAEILMLKAVLERQKKALVILPFVSVVREKTYYFQEIVSDSGIRVEGFMGSNAPAGGYKAVHVAVCTIEKANGLVNRMLEEGDIANLGIIIVDELHLLGDPNRGYILELLLTKILYMTKKDDNIQIQIVGMSATLPNLTTLAEWLNAKLYKTEFRPIPLYEYCLIGNEMFDTNFDKIETIERDDVLLNDKDHVIQLTLQTLFSNCSVLIFCPTKNWCENLAAQLSSMFKDLGYSNSQHGKKLRDQLNSSSIKEVIEQLRLCPVGLDEVLYNTISFGVAFHHAGLSMEEREIIENAFKQNVIRVLVATSTLSSGVNLPARRVIIRSATFHSKPMNIMTYKQMIGRAGRMGIDSAGESILIANDKNTALKLINGNFEPVISCLEGEDRLMRAILESIASEIVSTYEDAKLFTKSTLLFSSSIIKNDLENTIESNMNELINYELIRCSKDLYNATALGKACLSSSMSPQDGLILFKELQKARECFVLETDLHMIYLVTPYSICQQWGDINWIHFLKIWNDLNKAMKRVGELIGISESLLFRLMNRSIKTTGITVKNKIDRCKRFYTALALQDLVNEIPLQTVARNFSCSRGMLQSLQQSAATFAGMVTAFSQKLGWKSFEILVSQFQDRLNFGIQSDLIELMKLQSLNSVRARALYESNIQNLCQLAKANISDVEKALYAAFPFESEKERDGDLLYDVHRRNKEKNVWLTGKKGVSVNEAAKMLVKEARSFLQLDMGIQQIKWDSQNQSENCDEVGEILNENNSEFTNPVKNHKLTLFNITNSEEPQITKDDVNVQEITTQITKNNCDTELENKSVELIEDDNIFEESLNIDTQINNMLERNPENKTESKSISLDIGECFKCSFEDENSCLLTENKTKMNEKLPKCSLKRKVSSGSEDLLFSSIKLAKGDISINSQYYDSFTLEFSKRLLFEESDFKQIELPINCKSRSIGKSDHLTFINCCENRNIFDKIVIFLETCDIFSLYINVDFEITSKNKIGYNVIATHSVDSFNCSSDGKYVNNLVICVPDGFILSFNIQKNNSHEIQLGETLEFIRKILMDRSKTIVSHNIKEMYRILWECCKIKILTTCEDSSVMEWLLNPECDVKSISEMLNYYFDIKMSDLIKHFTSKSNLSKLELETCLNAWANFLIAKKLKEILSIKAFNMIQVFEKKKKEMKCLPILAECELNGIGIDKKANISTINYIKDLQKSLETSAFKLAGRYFKFSSPAEVAKVLGLYNKRKIKTNKRVLEKIENPLAQIIMYWRKLNAILTKTLYPLSSEITNKSISDRIHPVFCTFTLTGRITMQDPNLQCVSRNFEIPSELLYPNIDKNAENKLIHCRSIFVVEDENILISADYCQLELRLLAHFSQDDVLVKLLSKNTDVFKAIAAKWKCIPEEDVDDDCRQKAKQLCYGIIYGMGNKSLAHILDITELEANMFMHSFYSAYPKISVFMKSVIDFGRSNGYVETLSKRRRYLPLINSDNEFEKSQAERQAINTTIQGSAADILKSSIILLNDRIKKDFKAVDIKLVLLMHDEVIYEIPSQKSNEFKNLLNDCMTNNLKLLVPLPVKIKIGKNWSDLITIS